ncbi:ABC transporter G family member 8 [Acorus calamus]|uniref:ABC transporter G family member 8 n=1 Tax=Acorus calamus TaxID=4465 RepID=A0AAV9C0U5_ACOCL|nr:ABC transporter G family member 8 [Acorus calamus]
MADPHSPPSSSPPSSSPPSPLPTQHLKTYVITAHSISYTRSNTTKTSTSAKTFLLPPCIPSPTTYILRDVSFTARPSQVLGIIGPSGAGKSTLLDILAARTSPSQGTLLVNSTPLHPSSFRKLSAYVPQYDSSLPLLTVSETFAFAARLLLPRAGPSKVSSVVTTLLSELGLSHVAHVRLSCGLSGGERRRVSIGLSLLHDPAVLLLDEPTSGLDSASAFNVMQTLSEIAASRRRTVILSIHQPSYKILSTIDAILLLSKGTVLHHGTLSSLQTHLLSNGFQVPPQLNPLEYSMEILSDLHDAKDNSPVLVPALQVSLPPPHILPAGGEKEAMSYKSSRMHEIMMLYNRFWKIIYRSRQLLLTNTLEALGVGIFLGTIYIHVGFDKQGMEKRLGLFAFTLTFLLSSTTETLPIFVNERPILLRETSSGVYRLSSHLIANTLVFLPYLLAIAVLYSVSVYFLVGLCMTWQAFAYFVLVIWVVVLMANSFVLFLSSLAPNYIAGTSLVTVCLAGFFLFSGYFISKDNMPKYWLFMHYFSLYKYALDALLINEYSCSASKCFSWVESDRACAVTGVDVLDQRGLREAQRWTNIQIMFGFFVFYRVLCLFVLTRRASRFKN